MSASNKILQAAAGNAGEAVYVEDVFSTYLYEGTGATLSIDNGIDLNGEGGLVWIKERTDTGQHHFYDTERGATKRIHSNSTAAEATQSDALTAFNSNGFTLGTNSQVNDSGEDTCSWTFRKQAGFFDVVTYTGDGTSSNAISHNLGATPAFIILKPIDSASFNDWRVWHKDLSGQNYQLKLNATDAEASVGNFISQNSTTFTVGYTAANQSGINYVAYLFASDEQQFGDDSDEAIIKCGSYTGNATTREIDLGFEPQWILLKKTNATEDWYIIDALRGIAWPPDPQAQGYLRPNLSAEESGSAANYPHAIPNGIRHTFESSTNTSGANYIYVAIRRPMKTPEAGTEVFANTAYSGTSTDSNKGASSGFPLDLVITKGRNASIDPQWFDRMRGRRRRLITSGSGTETQSSTNVLNKFNQAGFRAGTDTDINNSAYTYVAHMFRRAPKFFDIVAYSGNQQAGRNITHNLKTTPEMIVVKSRTTGEWWYVYHKDLDATAPEDKYLVLNNTNNVADSANIWDDRAPTATTFAVGQYNDTNGSGKDYIAYLWASLNGICKVGSYTGNGSTQTIDCGFSAGARWVMLKRSSANSGNWIVIDSARGIVSGDDPFYNLNAAAAEDTTTDIIDPANSGFSLTSESKGNQSGTEYIFLAIA